MKASQRRFGLFPLLAALLVACVFVIAACGGDDSGSSSSSSSSGGGGSSTSSGGGSDSSGSEGYTQAQADFKKFQNPVGITDVPPIGKDIPSGKTIDFVACGPASCVPPADFTTAAAKQLGWKVKVINGGLTPESNKNAMAQAIRDKPDAVVQEGLDSSVFQPELKQLADMKIPVINWQTTDQPNIPTTWVIPGPSHYPIVAQMAAAAAMVAAKGKPVIGHIAVPVFPIYKNTIDPAINEAVKKYCPDCKVKTFEMPATSIGKDAASRIVGFLRGNQDVNVLIHDVGLTALGVDAAMKGASITDVKQVALYGTTANLPEIKSGAQFAMIPDPYQEMGWMVVDSLARHFTGGNVQDTVDLTAPAVTWTADNVPPAQGNQLAPSQPDFKQKFLDAWGVKG